MISPGRTVTPSASRCIRAMKQSPPLLPMAALTTPPAAARRILPRRGSVNTARKVCVFVTLRIRTTPSILSPCAMSAKAGNGSGGFCAPVASNASSQSGPPRSHWGAPMRGCASSFGATSSSGVVWSRSRIRTT